MTWVVERREAPQKWDPPDWRETWNGTGEVASDPPMIRSSAKAAVLSILVFKNVIRTTCYFLLETFINLRIIICCVKYSICS